MKKSELNSSLLALFGNHHHLSNINDDGDDDDDDNDDQSMIIIPDDEMKWDQEKPRKIEPYKDQCYRIPFNRNRNEINFIGGLGSNTGHKPSKYIINRPTEIQKIYNMKTRNLPIFTFCEDARLANNKTNYNNNNNNNNNIVKKKSLPLRDTNKAIIKETVEKVTNNKCLNDNDLDDGKVNIEFNDKLIENIDNPLNLDYHGLDYKNTYRRDEQGHQNNREYYIMKRAIDKRKLIDNLKVELNTKELNHKYGLPKYFDINTEEIANKKNSIIEFQNNNNSDNNVVVTTTRHWKQKYQAPNVLENKKFARPLPEAIPFIPSAYILGKIIRTTDKKENVQQMAIESNRRKENITKLMEKRKSKENERIKIATDNTNTNENLITMEKITIMNNKDQNSDCHTNKNDLRENNNLKENQLPIKTNYNSIKYMKRFMKQKNRKTKEKHYLRSKYMESLGHFNLTINQNDTLHFGSDVNNKIINLSDNSTVEDDDDDDGDDDDDDCDNLPIGKWLSTNKYQLKGFHCKSNADGGKFLKKQITENKTNHIRTSITRDEWLKEILPSYNKKQNEYFKEIPSTNIKNHAAQPDNYIIFEPITKYTTTMQPFTVGPISDAIRNNNYFEKQSVEKNIKNSAAIKEKVDRPSRNIKIKRFNLTGFLFGKTRRRRQPKQRTVNQIKINSNETSPQPLNNHKPPPPPDRNKYGVPFEIINKCNDKLQRKQFQEQQKIRDRMKILNKNKPSFENVSSKSIKLELDKKNTTNILQDIITTTTTTTATRIIDSSSDSDWIPSISVSDDDHQKQIINSISNLSLARSDNIAIQKPLNNYSLTNMPAPKFREPTLRRHPRRKRQQQQYDDDDDDVDDNRSPYNVPRLGKIPKDKIQSPTTLTQSKTSYTKLFNTRHHHQHHDHTQHKTIKVKYLPKIPQQTTEQNKSDDKIKTIPIFIKKNNQSTENINEKMNSFESLSNSTIISNRKQKTMNKIESESKRNNEIKMKYLQLIKMKKQSTAAEIKDENSPPPQKILGQNDDINSFHQWFIDKDKYLIKLKDELESIKSCNSSANSSICTNFTNDSGSYLLIEGKKVPCDYITKCSVPFEEMPRCRIKINNINQLDKKIKNEYINSPYYYVPYVGQRLEMRTITKPKDRFFTNNARLRFGVRERLMVESKTFSTEQIGINQNNKYLSQLATEWDEYYQHEIKNRPRIRRFKQKTILEQVRNSLRKQFVSDYIQEYIIEKKIVSQQENNYGKEVDVFRECCQPLFTKWEETYYRNYMRKMQQLKPVYEKTDKLRVDVKELRSQMDKLEMDIIYTEDKWRQLIFLQNFHYLMKEPKWREEFDWIHRSCTNNNGTTTNEKLDNYKESIEKRPYLNVRKRGDDSPWSIKQYYENNIDKFSVLLPFVDARAMLHGISMLKIRSFKCLLELHFSMWILANLNQSYNKFLEAANGYISKTTKYAQSRLQKKYFIEQRLNDIQKNSNEFLQKSLYSAVSDNQLRTLTALCDVMYKHFIPQTNRFDDDNQNDNDDDDDDDDDITIIEKFSMIENKINNILSEFDEIPIHIRKTVEKETRLQKTIELRQSKRACALEQRTQTVIEQLKKNLAPPPPPPSSFQRRTGKLPRSHLDKPKKIVKIKPKELSDTHKLFYKAFTDKETSNHNIHHDHHQSQRDDLKLLNNLQQNCIPFYFDHFLNLHDYYPSYDFKTQIEINEGPEIERFLYKDVLDAVQNSLQFWETRKKLLIQENIRKTQFLYDDDDDRN